MVLIKDCCILSNINLTIIAFSTFWLKVFVTSASLNFKVTRWSTRLDSKREFLPFTGRSLEQCVFECSIRTECKSVCFKRRMNFCEIHLNEVTDFASPDSTDTCVYIRREDITFPEVDTECSCGVGKVCEVTTGQCISKECQPFHITNGKIYGNVWHTNAKQRIKCDDGYEAKNGINTVVCTPHGTWDYEPACVLTAEATTESATTAESATTTPESTTTTLESATTTPESTTTTLESATTTPESTTTTSDNIIDCTAEWMHPPSNTSFRIKFSGTQGQQSEGGNVCTSIGATGLVKIDTEWKQTFIKEALTTCINYTGDCHWIDGTKNGNKWEFSDSSEMPISNVFWDYGDSGSQVCVSMNNDGFWTSSNNCNKKCNFICELVS